MRASGDGCSFALSNDIVSPVVLKNKHFCELIPNIHLYRYWLQFC